MAAWPELTRQFLRPEVRRANFWRSRVTLAFLTAAAGAWSAIAPQVHFTLGERLHLAFQTISAWLVVMALLAGLRHEPRHDPFLKVTTVAGWERGLGQLGSAGLRAINEVAALFPFLFLLLALQAISSSEIFVVFSLTAFLLAVSLTVTLFKGPTLLFPIISAALFMMTKRSWFESFLIALYAAHLYCKARVSLGSVARLRSKNLPLEATTLLTNKELCGFRLWNKPAVALVFAHVTMLSLVSFWPAAMEEKIAISLALVFGIFSLAMDVFALHWRAMLSGKPLGTMALVVGLPWAVAWTLAQLHTGDAFTLNEAAAYFLVWTALGSALSWILGNSAREKVQRNLREIMAASRDPSLFLYL